MGLLGLIFIAYWPTYFSKFFDGTADFSHYFHFHTVTALLWVLVLIVQPVLIRLKQRKWHKFVGKLSYGLVPILFISVMLLAHSRFDPETQNPAVRLWVPFKDLIIFSFGYSVGVIYRKNPMIHARGMVVSGMALVEPVMNRIFLNVLEVPRPYGIYCGISFDYIILIVLIILERRSTSGRWVFPCALVIFAFIHIVRLNQIILPLWDDFAHWFVSLPLT